MVVTVASCTSVRQFRRFFLTRCPADGPTPETEFDLHLRPVPMDAYYEALSTFAAALPRRELGRIDDAGRAHPIYLLGPLGTAGGRRLLVVAGVHGNEIAASLAAPRILGDARDRPADYAGVELWLVAPANPVGLAHRSRYNAEGCDVNRDFGGFRTPEARAIREAFTANRPELVVALHEGPQDGFFVIATPTVPPRLPEAAAEAAAASGATLARRSFLGLALGRPGVEREGRARTLLKRALRLGSLGTCAERHGVGALTTEGPWASADVDGRVAAQVTAVRAVARGLGGR
jgi:predicted deacylase